MLLAGLLQKADVFLQLRWRDRMRVPPRNRKNARRPIESRSGPRCEVYLRNSYNRGRHLARRPDRAGLDLEFRIAESAHFRNVEAFEFGFGTDSLSDDCVDHPID